MQYPNRNNQSFNDPILRVKSSAREGESAASVKRFGIPIFGITGMACFVAWLMLSFIPQAHLHPVATDSAFAYERLTFACALAVCCLASLAFPAKAFAVSSLKVIGLVAAVLAPAGWIGGLLQLDGVPACALWAVSGLATGMLALVWAQHLAAFTSQSQAMVAITGSLMLGSVLAYVSHSFSFPQSLVFCLAFPSLSAIIHFKAAPRVAKRDELLRSESSEQKSPMRYFVKEELVSCACLLVAGFLVFGIAVQDAGPWAILAYALAIFVGAFLMFQAVLHLSESLAFTLLGFLVPFVAVFSLIAAAGQGIVRLVAVAAILCMLSCLMVVHLSNVARNSKHVFADYTRGARMAVGIDSCAFACGWAFAWTCIGGGWFGEQSFAVGLLVVFAVMASIVALCLFSASPDSRHIPRVLTEDGSESKSLFGPLRSSVLVSEFELDRELEQQQPVERVSSSEEPAASMAERFSANVDRIIAPYNLSAREKDVFMYLARGYNAQSIAQKLTLSPNTVKTHIRNIYAKFDIHSQQDLVAYVERQIP